MQTRSSKQWRSRTPEVEKVNIRSGFQRQGKSEKLRLKAVLASPLSTSDDSPYQRGGGREVERLSDISVAISFVDWVGHQGWRRMSSYKNNGLFDPSVYDKELWSYSAVAVRD